MAAETVTLTIRVGGPDGQVVSGLPVSATMADEGLRTNSGVVVPGVVTGETDDDGRVTLALRPSSVVGSYLITIGRHFVMIDMPDEDADLSRLVPAPG